MPRRTVLHRTAREPVSPPLTMPWVAAEERLWELQAMTALNAMKRDVPPPSAEKMAENKRRLLALAEERRRERLIDLAG